MDKHSRNTVSLRLTESAAFLRTRPGRGIVENSQPTLLRGLLIVDLVKPTRISSIELELRAKSTTSWPEGFGARRVEITEKNTIFQASVVYFQAGQAPSQRPTSVGPGTLQNSDDDWDEYPHIVPSRNPSRPSTLPPSRQIRRRSVDGYANHSALQYDQFHIQIPPYSPNAELPGTLSAMPSPGSSIAHLPPLTNDLESPSSSMIHRRSTSAMPSLAGSRNSFSRSIGSQNGDMHHQNDYLDHCAPSSTRSLWRSTTPPPHGQDIHPGRQSRFSLASMSNALMDVIKLRQATHVSDETQARGRTLEKGAVNVRDRFFHSRGRTLDNGISDGAPSETPVISKERSTLSLITDFLRLDLLDDHKEYGSNWKEFKKGTYTYPISITIPGHCPPTLYCECGHLTWSLKAVVHRPGAFKAKLTATQEVIVVACPIDDDTEESENILVERHWDNQLQYLISVSGRSFCIGGTIPISFTFMPLAKVKIHKVLVCIEERVDYYTKMRRLAQSEPITRFILLSVKGTAKGGDPILPLDSDDVEAFKNSPLYRLVTPDDDPSQMAANLMGPGPWTFHQDLRLPKSCNQMHFTNRNRWSNVSITHTLKLVIRVESASDLHLDSRTGRRKLFDIVVQTPVHILSCRCNPDWIALPSYSEQLSNPRTVAVGCPCEVGRTKWTLPSRPALDRATSHQSSESSACSAESSPINPIIMRSLRQDFPTLHEVSSQFERLVSGQMAETGETPPAYED